MSAYVDIFLSWPYLFDRCPFRVYLGFGSPEHPERRYGGHVVLRCDRYEPIEHDIISDAVAVLERGQTVLLLADRRDMFERARREILAMAGTTAGAA